VNEVPLLALDELSIENIDTMTVYEEKEMSIFVTLNSGTNNFL